MIPLRAPKPLASSSPRLSLDHRRRPVQEKVKTSRAERDFARSLKSIADQVGTLIDAFPAGDPSSEPGLIALLEKYAEALTPWAERTARAMLLEVNERDRESWRSLGNAISLQLHRDLRDAPVGEAMRALLDEQVTLITSLPREAAERVHTLTLQGLEDSTRAAGNSPRDRVQRRGGFTKSRAMLIARTEVSRTASLLTQTRAEAVGSEGYQWETSKDGAVRPSHRAMQGKFVRWNDPPMLDDLTGHAGALPNCRCWPRPIIDLNQA